MTTLKQIQQHFKANNYEPRHSLKGLKYASNKLGRETKIDSFLLLLLVIENKPIPTISTHSYGFHTARGRYLIETFKSYYHNYSKNN